MVNAIASIQRIIPRAAIKPIVAVVAGNDIIARIARAGHTARTGQRQVLDIVRQRVPRRRLHRVRAFVLIFGNRHVRIINDVRIVTGTTDQGIRA